MNSSRLTCSFLACFLCLFILIATEKGLYRIPLTGWSWWKSSSSMVFSDQSQQEFLLKMEKIYGQRRARVNEICRKYAETFSWNLTDQVLSETLWYAKEHRLAYCPVNKAASTTMVQFLSSINPNLSLALITSPEDSLRPLIRKYHKQHLSQVNDVLSFLQTNQVLKVMFVRNPFARLISAYECRIKDDYGPEFRRARAILKSRGRSLTFDNFIRYIVEDQVSQCSDLACLKMNVHWRPAFSRCFVCDVGYDVIGTVETFEDDMRYILAKTNTTHLFPLDSHFHRGSYHGTKGPSDLIFEYFGQLSNRLLGSIYTLYKIDFEMFNYRFHPRLPL